jgi:RNA polymerase sigma factor (sigma-70 family)
MTAKDESRRHRLLRAARRGDRGARDRLVTEYLPLVRSLASRYRSYGLSFDDLVQEGCLGLLEAIDRYDAARGSGFESFARFRVRRAIRNALTGQSREIRLPKHVVERSRALDRTEARLAVAGLPVAPGDLARETGLPLETVLETQASHRVCLSLDERTSDGGLALGETIAHPSRDPEAETIEHERLVALEEAVATLDTRQQLIVAAQWGLDGSHPNTIADLAHQLGLSRRRTQAISRDALDTLRRQLEPLAR